MTTQHREALAALRFNWAETPDEVWTTSPYHVDGLHPDLEYKIKSGFRDADASAGPSPIGLVMQGQKGIGKTHLLGWVRREVQRDGGYFFLIALTAGSTFWEDVLTSIRSGLWRVRDDGRHQLASFLERLSARIQLPDAVAKSVTGDATAAADDLEVFVRHLRRFDPELGAE